jgi:NADH-quinone oxidoreductase subunit J
MTNGVKVDELILPLVVVLLGAWGTYQLLPHRHGSTKPRTTHLVGGIAVGLSILLFASFLKPVGPVLTTLFFYVFAVAALAGAVLTITSRDPIHSALWFASVVLSTSGLFLIASAQFLAAGTVIVYAGAIIVTFLFVIMLAQMQGKATYDRASRSPGRATLTCFLLFWGLLYSFLTIPKPESRATGTINENAVSTFDLRLISTEHLATGTYAKNSRQVADVLARASRPTSQLAVKRTMKPHVAALGETLFSDHLISVELAGTLLFVALVGALVIAAPKVPVRPGEQTAA